MATAIEALGMSLPYSSSTPADDPLKQTECKLAGEAILNLLKKDIKPRDIMTRKAFENAITLVMVHSLFVSFLQDFLLFFLLIRY
jgi:dihydroxy-acid dehydratase